MRQYVKKMSNIVGKHTDPKKMSSIASGSLELELELPALPAPASSLPPTASSPPPSISSQHRQTGSPAGGRSVARAPGLGRSGTAGCGSWLGGRRRFGAARPRGRGADRGGGLRTAEARSEVNQAERARCGNKMGHGRSVPYAACPTKALGSTMGGHGPLGLVGQTVQQCGLCFADSLNSCCRQPLLRSESEPQTYAAAGDGGRRCGARWRGCRVAAQPRHIGGSASNTKSSGH